MKNKILLISLIAVFFLSACKNNSGNKDTSSLESVTAEETKDVISSIPAPNSLEIMKALNDAGASYIYDVTNDPTFVENYMSTKQKAIGLGIYCADLSYLTTYNQKDILPYYIKAVSKLSDELEISSIEMDRIQNNMDNKDSLTIVVKELFEKSNEYLNSNQKVDIAMYVLASSWIETVFITDKIIEFSENQQPLLKVILDNKGDFDKVVELFEKRKTEEGFDVTYEHLKKMQDLFNDIVKNPTNEEPVEELKSYARSIRAEII